MVKKVAVGVGMVTVIFLGMFFTGRITLFVDFPSLVFVGLLGGLSLLLRPDKGGRNFIESGWVIFAIGIIAGMSQQVMDQTPLSFAANLAIATIALLYGYAIGLLVDAFTPKQNA